MAVGGAVFGLALTVLLDWCLKRRRRASQAPELERLRVRVAELDVELGLVRAERDRLVAAEQVRVARAEAEAAILRGVELGLRYRVPSGGAGPGGQVGPLTPGPTSTTGGTGGQRAEPATAKPAEEAVRVERKPVGRVERKPVGRVERKPVVARAEEDTVARAA
jgi:hypothetical protein